MAKPTATFRCAECGWTTAKWVGRCGECQAWGTVEEVHTAEETLIFALPPELRRDLKAVQDGSAQ